MVKIKIELKNEIEYPRSGILSKVLHKSKGLDVTLFTIKKGSEIGEHTSTRGATVQLIEGKINFNLSGKNIQMVPGSIILMKKNQVHSLKAVKNSAFLLTIGGIK